MQFIVTAIVVISLSTYVKLILLSLISVKTRAKTASYSEVTDKNNLTL